MLSNNDVVKPTKKPCIKSCLSVSEIIKRAIGPIGIAAINPTIRPRKTVVTIESLF